MTKQEAIKHLEFLKIAAEIQAKPERVETEALDMAIKALEQEPCEDCISRQTIKDIDRAFKALEERDELLDKIRAEILNFKEKCNASDYLGCGILEIIDKYKAESEDKE